MSSPGRPKSEYRSAKHEGTPVCNPRQRERSDGTVRIAPQTGVAFKLRGGEVLRVCDPCGEQVADLFAFKDGELACSLSSGRSIDYAGKI